MLYSKTLVTVCLTMFLAVAAMLYPYQNANGQQPRIIENNQRPFESGYGPFLYDTPATSKNDFHPKSVEEINRKLDSLKEEIEKLKNVRPMRRDGNLEIQRNIQESIKETPEKELESF